MKLRFSRIVPHGTLILVSLLLICSHSLRADVSVSDNAEPAPSVSTLIALASEHAEANMNIQLGLREMLMGWNEMARAHFSVALRYDPDSAVAWCALLVLGEDDKNQCRAKLEGILTEDYVATPQESALLSSWLRLAGGGHSGAGEEFAERAEQYRQDVLSAAWAIRLLHDGYDELGAKPLPNQQRALQLAAQLYERRPDDPLVAYMRAWVEAAAPVPSAEALEAARRAAAALPNHPAAQHLLGHLLYRTGHLKEAIASFHSVSTAAEQSKKMFHVEHGDSGEVRFQSAEMCPLVIRAKLYESTLLWLNAQRRESLLIQAELQNYLKKLPADSSASSAAVLLRWEARTLPLRLLMLQAKLPTDKQISAALQIAAPAQADKNEPLFHVAKCLHFCLVTRQRAASGKTSQALRCIQAAEGHVKKFEESRSACAGQGDYVVSAWVRMHQACQIALFAARAAAYADTSDVWLQSMEALEKPATLLMPPAVPRLK